MTIKDLKNIGGTGSFHIFIQGSASADTFGICYPRFVPHYDNLYKKISFTCVGSQSGKLKYRTYDVTAHNNTDEYGKVPEDLPMLRSQFIYQKLKTMSNINTYLN